MPGAETPAQPGQAAGAHQDGGATVIMVLSLRFVPSRPDL